MMCGPLCARVQLYRPEYNLAWISVGSRDWTKVIRLALQSTSCAKISISETPLGFTALD